MHMIYSSGFTHNNGYESALSAYNAQKRRRGPIFDQERRRLINMTPFDDLHQPRWRLMVVWTRRGTSRKYPKPPLSSRTNFLSEVVLSPAAARIYNFKLPITDHMHTHVAFVRIRFIYDA